MKTEFSKLLEEIKRKNKIEAEKPPRRFYHITPAMPAWELPETIRDNGFIRSDIKHKFHEEEEGMYILMNRTLTDKEMQEYNIIEKDPFIDLDPDKKEKQQKRNLEICAQLLSVAEKQVISYIRDLKRYPYFTQDAKKLAKELADYFMI